jgi:lipoyl(octanoyl) transferase
MIQHSQPNVTKTCRVVDLGRIGYGEALALQQRLVAARKTGAAPDVLLLCEHPHVITLGRNGKIAHLLAPDAVLRRLNVEFQPANRGGDITYHGPGQLIAYPIVQLAEIRRDVAWYVRQLEQAMIEASAAFGVAAFRVAGRTGVWARPGCAVEEKLGAIGVHISRWVTSHGLAYNVSTDLPYFDLIVPCGIAGRRATSLEKLVGRAVPRADFAACLVGALGRALGVATVPMARAELGHLLGAAEAAEPAAVAGA